MVTSTRPSAPASIISTDRLTRRYGERRGIEDVSLGVPEGSLFGFLGPNGAGKTTTIRVLLGLLRPTSGSARIFGLDCVTAGPRIRADLGYVPGDLRLYPYLSGDEALRLFGRIRGRDLFPAGRELAEEFELDLCLKVRQMSRGTRQKLGLVLALAHSPRLLVLDEPTSTLDPIMQERFRERLRRLARAGHTVFFSSHALAEVESLCDRVAIVKDGRIVADETLEELRRSAGREVRILWRDAASASSAAPPTDFEVTRRDGRSWAGVARGPLAPFLEWLSRQPLEDLSIAPPDLDTVFRRFYQGGPS